MSVRQFFDGRAIVHHADSRDVLKTLPDASIDSICTDPPYALVSIVKRFGKAGSAPAKGEHSGGAYARASAGFMGQEWDTGETAFSTEFWAEAFRVLKPGGHIIAFSGSRTYHRLAVAIEDAGFEIRDMLSWLYGTGFPKSHDVSKGIDKAAGAVREVVARAPDWKVSKKFREMEGRSDVPSSLLNITIPATDAAREWQGWGTALKPAHEPIVLARKPLIGTVAANVLAHGTGAINIDGCRIEAHDTQLAEKYRSVQGAVSRSNSVYGDDTRSREGATPHEAGRFPANVLHDGSAEVVDAFDAFSKGSSRFFYSAKASKADRAGSKHPTVKRVDLMRWLVRLVTPRGGVVLEPFAGSGTTVQAALEEGARCIAVEREAQFFDDICQRLERVTGEPVGAPVHKEPRQEATGAEVVELQPSFEMPTQEAA